MSGIYNKSEEKKVLIFLIQSFYVIEKKLQSKEKYVFLLDLVKLLQYFAPIPTPGQTKFRLLCQNNHGLPRVSLSIRTVDRILFELACPRT